MYEIFHYKYYFLKYVTIDLLSTINHFINLKSIFLTENILINELIDF